MKNKTFIAHVRKFDNSLQTLSQHLTEVAELSSKFASKVGLTESGRIIGLVHDIGKYSSEFQNYIRDITGMEGEERRAEAESKIGKIDHATSGAQIIWDKLTLFSHKSIDKRTAIMTDIAANILSTCVACHHSRKGLYDFISPDGGTPFLDRIKKNKEITFIEEVKKELDADIQNLLEKLLCPSTISSEFISVSEQILKHEKESILRDFHFGLITRFLFSCLIDADRLNTANFENPKASAFRNTDNYTDWHALIGKLENHLRTFESQNHIDELRTSISDACKEASGRPRGIFTLTVPTGGGKTLSSLRFALHHALHHSSIASKSRIERIIYVVPYTSIIEQNAKTVRAILGEENIVEHHSNLLVENDTWRNDVLSENWDAPIVFTTSVQFLNALFSHPTSDVRRMHQLANSIIIFDEIQKLPIKTVHLFNNAANFLVQSCGASFVLCTATQPLLHKVNSDFGSIKLNSDSNIVSDDLLLWQRLRRTEVKDSCKPGGYSVDEIADLSVSKMRENGSVLVIVNTKSSALNLYQKLYNTPNAKIYHLSTNMCPAHRKDIFANINVDLQPGSQQPIICISTQLIEAGVDIDFGSVIRYLAGLDSIAQAAGRCNRHGKRSLGLSPILIVNPSQENLDNLPEIQRAQGISRRILDEFRENPESFENDLLSPVAIQYFFDLYFYKCSSEMVYPISSHNTSDITCDCNLVDLFSKNSIGVDNYKRIKKKSPPFSLRQANSTASMVFKVIDAPTQGVLVPYKEEGKRLIAELGSAFVSPDCPLNKQIKLLHSAQQYSVNVFPHQFAKLNTKGCIYEIQKDSGIFCLREEYYSNTSGISCYEVFSMSFLNF